MLKVTAENAETAENSDFSARLSDGARHIPVYDSESNPRLVIPGCDSHEAE